MISSDFCLKAKYLTSNHWMGYYEVCRFMFPSGQWDPNIILGIWVFDHVPCQSQLCPVLY